MALAMTQEALRASLLRRFHERVDRRGPGECWEWTHLRNPDGYGLISMGKQRFLAHRLALDLDGRPPGDLYALHRCDNPPCCNPAHLYVGTLAENNADAKARGRMLKDTCRRGHAKTPDNLYVMTDRRGYLLRFCKKCQAINAEKRRKVRKAL